MGSERCCHPISTNFTLSLEVLKIFVLSEFSCYSFSSLGDMHFKPIRGRGHARFSTKFILQMPLPNVNLCTKLQSCILFWSLVMAIYLFSINGVLWAWQWSDYAHLRTRPYFFAKEHVYQVSSRYLNFYSSQSQHGRTDGRTDSHPDFNSSLHPDHLYIYIILYLSRLVRCDTNNRQVNKTIILCSNSVARV